MDIAAIDSAISKALKSKDVLSQLLQVFSAPIGTETDVNVVPDPVCTPVTGGYSVQLFATISPGNGETLYGVPACELFVGNYKLASKAMTQIYGTLWHASFQPVYPCPDSTKVTATFFSPPYNITTLSDVEVVNCPNCP